MKKYLLLFAFLMVVFDLSANDSLRAGNSFSVIAGKRTYRSLGGGLNNTKIDFFEYTKAFGSEMVYIGFEIKKSFKKKHFVSLRATSHDDIELQNLSLGYGRMLNKNLGFALELSHFEIPTTNTPPFNFPLEYPQYFHPDLIVYNRMEFVSNKSLSLSPFFRIRKRLFWVEANLNLGLGTLNKNHKNYSAQSNSSFEVIRVQYNAKPSMFIFCEPQLSAAFFPFQMKKSEIGFQIKASTMPSSRSYNYKRRIDIWTADQPIIENVSGSKYKINRLEVDFGLVWEN